MDTWYYKVDAHTVVYSRNTIIPAVLPRDQGIFLNENVVRSGSNAKTSTNTKPKLPLIFRKTTTNTVDLNGRTTPSILIWMDLPII